MKKGMILYLTEVREDAPPRAAEELVETSRALGVTTVCVAVTEDDAVRGWWRLLTKGMQQVLFMKVGYNAALERFESRGAPVLLGGLPIMN